MSLDLLNGILLCPLSGEVLRLESGQLKSSRLTVPNIEGIPWLYRDPAGALRQWQKKIGDVLEYSHQQIEAVERALAGSELLPSTRTRLKRIHEGHTKNIAAITGIASAILSSDDQRGDIITLERVPRQQSAMAYQGTLFRDWAWGRDQIKKYAELIAGPLKGQKKIAFLGAGACGLPLAIHNELQPNLSLAVDINPLLFLPAKKLISGGAIEVVEFPNLPRESAQEYVAHQLRLADSIAPNFEMVFCDGQSLPVKDGVLDAVVTSWFIDIIPRDLRELARLINCVMEMGGVWSNIGTLGFERHDYSQVYRPDEVKDILQEAGFAVEAWSTPEVPYLRSPYNAIGRQDQIWTFAAKKVKAAKRPPVYDYWPKWVVSTSEPVPMTESIREYRVKSAIYTFVLDQVDGQRSIEDIAKTLGNEFSIPFDEAVRSVHNFFANYFEGVIFREF